MGSNDTPVVQEEMLEEVLGGLKKEQKELSSKYFYDKKGSWLFDRICKLKEYYPTRTEIEILKSNIEEIRKLIGSRPKLIEFGSGSSEKTQVLLDNLQEIVAYVPIDISRDFLFKATKNLGEIYPDLDIYPVCADYTRPFELPEIEKPYEKKIIFYPGSTIGNFTPDKAHKFLQLMAEIAGQEGGLLIGVDLKKEREVLERAYNDSQGVTAAFNKNILEHINRELNADFDLRKFEHNAFYNEEKGRVEMHLVSRAEQQVNVNGTHIKFEKGESIHTENSHKYTEEEFKSLVEDCFEVEKVWKDAGELFSVQYLRVK